MFRRFEISLDIIAKSCGFDSFDASGTKQLLFDEYGSAHVTFASNGIVYLTLDPQWNIIDYRSFLSDHFLGMAIDSSGVVHIALC